LVLMGWTLW